MKNEEKTNDSESSKAKKCPLCGASMKMYWQPISRGLAVSLVEFRKKAIIQNNKVHIKNDIDFTKTEFNNFQKLRYHGLVAKWVNKTTKQHEGGYWLLTRRGNLFCKNQLEVPKKVKTFRNKIWDKSDEMVYLSDILKNENMPYWKSIENLEFEFEDISDVEEIKFNSNGQFELFN